MLSLEKCLFRFFAHFLIGSFFFNIEIYELFVYFGTKALVGYIIQVSLFYMVLGKGPTSFFCMWISSFPNIICSIDCPIPTEWYWDACQKVVYLIYM